jgi:serine/threonine-protein kinase
MKWIEGGSLAAHIERYRKDPRAAAQLLLQIARTMQYAHECRVLHRDLKPSNILLDADGRPYVIDFGLAYFVDYQLDLTGDGQILGTAPYMSPEQAEGRKDSFTPATDVYGLGAILYELLTGRPPFRTATAIETIRQVIQNNPVPPRTFNRAVHRDLQTICLKCLEKDPRWRYSSAGELANYLERWLQGESIGPPPSPLARSVRFCRRRPAVVTLASLAIGLLAVAWLLEDRERCEVARGNLYAAKFVANTVLGELEDLATPVAQAAHDPRLRELLAPHGASGLQAYVEHVARSAAPEHGSADPSAESPYETWFVLDAAGKILAVAPLNPRIIGRDFSGRDYFQGAERHAGEPGEAAVHVSRVFRAENDGLWKFALAAPICDGDEPDARVLGVVATTITTTSTLGPVGLDDDRRTVVLAGREDPNPPAGKAVAPRPSSYLILRHPAYHRGDPAVPVTGEWLRPLDRTRHGDEFRYTDAPEHLDPRKATDLGYHDPLATQDAAYAGRWLLGAAPVGVTELVVLVQQRAPILGVSPWSGFTSALGAILFGIAGYGAFRALRRQGN